MWFLLSSSSAPLTKLCWGHHCLSLQLRTLPTLLSSAYHWFPSQVRICGHPLWIPSAFCLSSGHLHLFIHLSFSPGLWSIVVASWFHTLRNKFITPILKNSPINLSFPFRQCLSPSFVGWLEELRWCDCTFQSHEFTWLWGWFLLVVHRFLEQRGK